MDRYRKIIQEAYKNGRFDSSKHDRSSDGKFKSKGDTDTGKIAAGAGLGATVLGTAGLYGTSKGKDFRMGSSAAYAGKKLPRKLRKSGVASIGHDFGATAKKAKDVAGTTAKSGYGAAKGGYESIKTAVGDFGQGTKEAYKRGGGRGKLSKFFRKGASDTSAGRAGERFGGAAKRAVKRIIGVGRAIVRK